MAKLKDIRHWYYLKPEFEYWWSPNTEYPELKSAIFLTYQETWYGADSWFADGLFMYLRFKKRSLHVRLDWWKMKGTL
jgi:hypothetical protein